jgi:hypothetical protein
MQRKVSTRLCLVNTLLLLVQIILNIIIIITAIVIEMILNLLRKIRKSQKLHIVFSSFKNNYILKRKWSLIYLFTFFLQ